MIGLWQLHNSKKERISPGFDRPALMMADQQKKKGKGITTQFPKRYNIMNTITKIENGKIYTESTLNNRNDIFEIVEKIPSNYFVWNIGENMGTDEYIPICEDLHPEDKENFEIDTTTLKTIKLPINEVKALREAAHIGIVSKKTAEKALKSKRRGYWSDKKREQAEKTIDIFNKITA